MTSIPLKYYDLARLLSFDHFPTDTEDGIESVYVESVEMVSLDGGYGAILSSFFKSKESSHSLAKRQFSIYSPIECGYYPSKATLCICFKSEGLGQERRILPIIITSPNQCDLDGKTEQERLIGEKYLKRWGLLRKKEAGDANESSKTGLSLEDFKVLNWIATSSSGSITGRALVDHFSPSCYRLIEAGALVHIANLEQMWVEADHNGGRRVEVVRYEGKDAYFSSTEGWVEVDPLDIKLYQVSSEWLLKTFKEALKIPPSVKPRVILVEKIWALGDAWLHKVRHPIILGQNLYSDEVFKTLEAYLKKKS